MPKRQSSTIEHPIFGAIKWSAEGSWDGRVQLRVFAGYDDNRYAVDIGEESSRRTTIRQRRERAFADGLFHLRIACAEGERPTAAQEEAYRFLVDHESEVVESVMTYVFRAYSNRDNLWTLDGLTRQEFGVDMKSPSDLKQLMRLATVSIEQSGGDVADIIFYFNSALDEEHGVEVTTNRTDIKKYIPDCFPFVLPAGRDATEIEPEPAGHRLVEFQIRGAWRGIYVLDDGLQCVGFVASSFTPRRYRDLLNGPDQIEGVRAATRWQRWFASPARRRAAGWLTASNRLVSLPCLLIAWAYLPQLFWVSLILSVLCIVGIWILDEAWRLLPLAQVVASIAGLVYASNSRDFGSQEHVAEVLGVYGSIVWWCVAATDTLAIMVLVGLTFGFGRDLIREGLGALLSALLMVVPVTSGLVASSYGYWSPFQLLWLTPLAFVASLVLLFTSLFTGIFDFSTPCPECGEPLRTRNAKQCINCGADWH